jgi:hypothetical protein
MILSRISLPLPLSSPITYPHFFFTFFPTYHNHSHSYLAKWPNLSLHIKSIPHPSHSLSSLILYRCSWTLLNCTVRHDTRLISRLYVDVHCMPL